MVTNNSINSVLIGSAQKSSFGELLVSELSASVQLQFPYIINTDIVSTSTTGSGSVTHSAPFCVLSTTAAASSTAEFSSIDTLHYRTGQGGLCMFTAVFTTGAADSSQIIGIGNSVDGFFFGYDGATFGILHRNNSSDNWIAKSSWNNDVLNGTGSSAFALDPTKGNVYRISYQWLGYGNICFFVENPNTGQFVLVHEIKYANSSASTSLTNPTLALHAKVANTTNATNIVLKTPSFSGFVEGKIVHNDVRFAINNSKPTVTTELNILTIQNKSTFNSITNKKVVLPDFLSFTTTGNPDCTFKLYRNATLGGSPSYTDIAVNNSVVSYDVAGTTVSSGRLLGVFFVNGNNETTIDIGEMDLRLRPGEKFTISATSSGAAIAPACAIMWAERY